MHSTILVELKKTVFLTIVLLLLSTAMVVGFSEPVVDEGIIFIRADGSVEGTDKIQSNGNVYTFIDNIFNQSIIVERDNIVVDGAGYTLQGTGSGEGIDLTGRSNVTIKNMEIKAFTRGIWLGGSLNISGNNITNNGDGIVLSESSNNTISGNNIMTNSDWGILLHLSSNNTISGNNIMTNNNYGIRLWNSLNNSIYHNMFLNNSVQVDIYQSPHNVWDDGHPSGGNYWSDYNGTDANQDGIGDTPYVIDANNQDNFPLMGMFYDFPVTYQEEIYPVTIICNSTISEFKFTNNLTTIINGMPGTWLVNVIVFNVSGEDGTLGFCRICIPMALMNEPYEVFVKGTWVPYTLLPCSNNTHNYLYFTYNHSTQEVVIIPEFPTWTQMLLVLNILTVIRVIYKRRLLKTPIH